MSEMGNNLKETSLAEMERILADQKKAYLDEGIVSTETRHDRIERAINILMKHDKIFADAMSEDFGHRSQHQSLFTDIASSITPLRLAQANLKKWQRPEKRKVTPRILGLLGAKAWIEYQPLGVIGVISPWNFPVNLTFTPLAGVLSAGNRCMIKPSEYTPLTSAAMAQAFKTEFDESEIAVITGGPETGADFSGLAFDHLLFTGATSIAKHVMRAAAENLVPVTLELGGKSPVIVGREAEMEKTTDSIMMGKTMNAGQICLAPDYVFVPENKTNEFIEHAKSHVQENYPTIKNNPDYTSIIHLNHYDRLRELIKDAEAKGATVLEINPANEDLSQQEHHKILPTLILNPTDDMQVMKEEIFGPLSEICSKGSSSLLEPHGHRHTSISIIY